MPRAAALLACCTVNSPWWRCWPPAPHRRRPARRRPGGRHCRPAEAITGTFHRIADGASAPGQSRTSCRRGPCWSAGFRRHRPAIWRAQPDGVHAGVLAAAMAVSSRLPAAASGPTRSLVARRRRRRSRPRCTARQYRVRGVGDPPGWRCAAELKLVLSAPALSRRRIFDGARRPP